eukprot:2145331-Rhodomonas_salina.2
MRERGGSRSALRGGADEGDRHSAAGRKGLSDGDSDVVSLVAVGNDGQDRDRDEDGHLAIERVSASRTPGARG